MNAEKDAENMEYCQISPLSVGFTSYYTPKHARTLVIPYISVRDLIFLAASLESVCHNFQMSKGMMNAMRINSKSHAPLVQSFHMNKALTNIPTVSPHKSRSNNPCHTTIQLLYQELSDIESQPAMDA